MNDSLLIYNVRDVGHFTVYSHNLTRWALSRGLRVIYCGLDADRTGSFKRYHGHPLVTVLHIADVMESTPPPDDAAVVRKWFTREMAARQLKAIRTLQERFHPRFTFLVNTDDFVFNHRFEMIPRSPFPAPTFGVITFGNQEYYTGFESTYSRRMHHLLKQGRPFDRLFTLDEYQVAREEPEQKRLVFLPDPCREFGAQAIQYTKWKSPRSIHLRHFLRASDAPVIAIIGKFDDRKNNLWLLQLAAEYPDLCLVILGQYVPSREKDDSMNTILSRLNSENRLLVYFDFVEANLFDILLASDRVRFVALPYLAHYGSSGIQVLVVQHGKPVLVPDNGLMGKRGVEAGIGRIFKHGDFQSFRKEFALMLESDSCAYRTGLAQFRGYFSERNLYHALDYGFGLTGVPPHLPEWTKKSGTRGPEYYLHYQRALSKGFAGHLEDALQLLEEALVSSPGHSSLLLLKVVFLLRLGRMEEALGALAVVSCGLNSWAEVHSFVLRAGELIASLLEAGEKIYPEGFVDFILPLLKDDVNDLKLKGDICVFIGRNKEAAMAYAQALQHEHDRSDIRLSLSDVLRYEGCYAKSLEVLSIGSEAAPNEPGFHCKRGQVLWEQGNVTGAIEAFRRECSFGEGPFTDMAQRHLQRLSDVSGASKNSEPTCCT